MFRSRLARLLAVFAAAPLFFGTAGLATAGAASAAGSCNPGTIMGNDSACYLVPTGSYMPNSGYSYAFACPLPYSTAGFGATSASQCNVLSSPGSYATEETYDGLGLFTPFYRVVFKPCAPGSYNPYTGQTTCYAALPGTYIDVSGATNSSQGQACPAGTFSTGGAAACTNAAPGYHPESYTGSTGEVPCAPGSSSPGAQPYCDLVPRPPSLAPFGDAPGGVR